MSEVALNTGMTTQLVYSKEKLMKLYGVDLLAAVSSSAMVSPFIAVVDRSIIENLNGRRPLVEGIKYGCRSVLSQPFKFAYSPQFRLVLGIYFSTYATANLVETTCEQYSVESSKASMIKFVATTAANMSMCIVKDKAFARMFGTVANHSLPKISYFLFALRDSLTVAASFTAPVYISSMLQNSSSWSISEKASNTIAQLSCPAAVQVISTPIHLLALDLYNRPGMNFLTRGQLIKKEYIKSTLARIGRVGPAFGIGGVGNSSVRAFRKTLL